MGKNDDNDDYCKSIRHSVVRVKQWLVSEKPCKESVKYTARAQHDPTRTLAHSHWEYSCKWFRG